MQPESPKNVATVVPEACKRGVEAMLGQSWAWERVAT